MSLHLPKFAKSSSALARAKSTSIKHPAEMFWTGIGGLSFPRNIAGFSPTKIT